MHIVADTASLISPTEGKEMGISVIPACTLINGNVYRDYEDISSEEILEMIKQGGIPTSSQPAIGDVLEIFEQTDDEILYLTIGDGLSGTYQNAVGARNCVEDNDRIHILDTKTLAGAQRYLVEKALKLRSEGLKMDEIISKIKESVENSVSFVIPTDFDFLKRSGRLTPLAANLGNKIKLVPVMTQTEDMKKIRLFTIKRSPKKALEAIADYLEEIGVGRDHFVFVGDGGAGEVAKDMFGYLRRRFADAAMELRQLAPALVTHGGPGCVVVQAILK